MGEWRLSEGRVLEWKVTKEKCWWEECLLGVDGGGGNCLRGMYRLEERRTGGRVMINLICKRAGS